MKRYQLAAMITCSMLVLSTLPLYAESFDGREAEMDKKCAAIYDEETRQECSAYKDYLQNKKQEADKSVTDLNVQIASVKGDIDKTTALITSNEVELHNYETEIQAIDIVLKDLNSSMNTLESSIQQTQQDIDQRDMLLKNRMIETQPTISCNVMIDFIMGAENFTDILRRLAIVSELTAYEQDQIKALEEAKATLYQQQEDLKTQQELQRIKLEEQTAKKAQAELLKKANEELLISYREKEAALQEAKVKAQLASGTYASAIPNIDLTILPPTWNNDPATPENPPQDQPSLSSGFVQPVQGDCYPSAGTWYYPLEFSGGIPLEHLGMDFGTYQRVGLPVVAPASGVVVAIYDGIPNHSIGSSGLNSWTGYPAGGGNTLHMITSVKGICYGISFYHLSPGMFDVTVGSVVSQGQVMAHTGHSGNTSGPHCHVEVTKLGPVSIEQGVQTFYRYGKDYFYGNYNVNGRCEVKGTTPCLEKPEQFFS